MKRILSVFSALVLSGSMALAANLPLQTGPVDPGNVRGVINSLIQSINTGVAGLINAQTGGVSNTTSIEQTLMSYTTPATLLATAGQSLRVSCWGKTAANTDAKTVKLYFGSTSGTSSSFTTLSGAWVLNMRVMRVGELSQAVFFQGQQGTTVIASQPATATENLNAGVLIKCTGSGTATLNDIEADGMITEIVK